MALKRAAVLLALLLPAATSAAAQSIFTSGAMPAFTAAQAERGKAAYGQYCAGCHGVNLSDGQFGTPLKGSVFERNWSPRSPDALYTYIVTRMPPSGAGTLTDDIYTDIHTFILQANGFAPGSQEARPVRVQGQTVEIGNRDARFSEAQARRKALLAAMKPVSDADLRQPGGDWLHWRGDYQTTSFSPLAKISKANVRTLVPAWSLSLPASVNEITPLVHDGVMFLQSGTMVEALDAATGEMLWQYVYPFQAYNARDARPKSIGIYQNMIYAPMPDGHLVALDFRTGMLLWDRQIIAPEQALKPGASFVGLSINSGPLIANGKVMIGVSRGHDVPHGSFIAALDAKSGTELWRFVTIPKDDDSWNGTPYDQRFGAGVWVPGSYDPVRNLAFFGTGNTYNIGSLVLPQSRKGASNDALYTDTTLALNPDTGRLGWYYQHMARDVWDLDWAFERSLITLTRDGKSTDLVVTGGKPGIFDAVERATGRYVFSKDLGLQNVVIAIDPVTGRKTTDPKVDPETGKAKFICPGATGVRNWLTTAFDPFSSILYVPALESCADYTWTSRSAEAIAKGGSDTRYAPKIREGHDGKFGRIEAIDLRTGKVVWSLRQRAAMASSLLATAGGLVFSGTFERQFRALDAATGDILWQMPLNAPPNASPITYEVAGTQYVAIAAGGGGPIDGATSNLTPEIYNPPATPTLWVFKLAPAN
jgi:alcohol dehydrogenase (cytochrome c)